MGIEDFLLKIRANFRSNLQKLPDNFAIGVGDFVNHFVVISINK